MNELSVPALICEYLSDSKLGVFVPEVRRDGCAAVFLEASPPEIKTYIDGSYIESVPFEICVQCAGEGAGERLGAVSFFESVDRYAADNPVNTEKYGICDAMIKRTSGISKSAVFDNGTEEYRAAYRFTCRIKG